VKKIDLILLILIQCLCFNLGNAHAANTTSKNGEGVTLIFLDQDDSSTTQSVLLSAMSLEGIKYQYGGSTPATGFDCSGLVNYVFHQAVDMRLPRTSRGLSRVGTSVAKNRLKTGDLVFFNTSKRAYSHVGIYVGDGKFIHAPRTGTFVRVDSMSNNYWKKRFDGAKRIAQN